MKKIILIIAIFLVEKGIAQNDSLTFKNTLWHKEKIAKGVEWQYFHFAEKQLFAANQNINILKIKPKKGKIAFGSAGDTLALTSDLAQKLGAKVAVNGSFFDIKNGGAVDFIKINGQILDTSRLNKNRLAEHQKAGIAFQKNTVLILKADTNDVKWAEKLPYADMMITGPLLIWQGKSTPLSISAFNDNRHPRTCACVLPDKTFVLVTADGRTPEAQGLSLHEATKIMRWLGCRDAVNLDGGGSTTMWIAGKGVVNMPCDNKKFDHEGERKVSNIVFF